MKDRNQGVWEWFCWDPVFLRVTGTRPSCFPGDAAVCMVSVHTRNGPGCCLCRSLSLGPDVQSAFCAPALHCTSCRSGMTGQDGLLDLALRTLGARRFFLYQGGVLHTEGCIIIGLYSVDPVASLIILKNITVTHCNMSLCMQNYPCLCITFEEIVSQYAGFENQIQPHQAQFIKAGRHFRRLKRMLMWTPILITRRACSQDPEIHSSLDI